MTSCNCGKWMALKAIFTVDNGGQCICNINIFLQLKLQSKLFLKKY